MKTRKQVGIEKATANPQLKQLAQETRAKIEAIALERDKQMQLVYEEYKSKREQIISEWHDSFTQTACHPETASH